MQSPFAHEVIERLQAVYAIEAEICGLSAEQRLAARRTQLVKWCADRTFRRDERGEEVLFAGSISPTYESPSVIDPVHNLALG